MKPLFSGSMGLNKRVSPLVCFFIDFILLNFSFFMMNFLKRGVWTLSPMYFRLLVVFNVTWLLVSIFMKKFSLSSYKGYIYALYASAKSILFIAYLISFMVIATGFSSFSRLHIFGTCVMLFALETALCTIYYIRFDKEKLKHFRETLKETNVKLKISIPLLVSDIFLLIFSFFLMNLYKRGTFRLSSDYQNVLFLICGLWLVVSNVAHKFDKENLQNFYYAIAACVKSVLLMGAVMSVVIFALRLFYFSRLHIFGTFLLLFFFEAIVYYFYFLLKSSKSASEDIESLEAIHDFFDQKKLPVEKEKQKKAPSSSFMSLLMNNFLRVYPDFFEFVSRSIDVSKFEDSEILIMNTPDISNVRIVKDHSLKILTNFHKINDIRWVNRYFLEVHKKLANGAYFVGSAETIDIHKKKFFKKYPKHYAEVLYILHFVLFRVLPKVPKIKKIYFALTKGRNRILSRAEVLGRLYFCGFEVIAEKKTRDNIFFFIARKVKTPSPDQNPSYGPVVTLKRVGLNGQMIRVFKFRTMYPYSEYLQKYIYQNHKLDKDGKINNDFRVTEWGRFMRRYWLDELPMVYNWIKGEVKLFGVRPLSKHYLSLYERKLREMRQRVKPGIIPPFYADLPGRFHDILESERKYIQAYRKNPLKTQLIYFWRAVSNIIIKGARSG